MNTNKSILRWGIIISGILGIPAFAHAEIIINEVAWMGTSNSQYEEWVELYNDGSDTVALSDWKLFKSGGTTLFSLTGTIDAGQYYVVCRTTGTLTNPLAGACDEQGAFGGSGLNNTSDQIILEDSGGAEIDSVDGTGGWPAGDAASKQTMQKNGASWVTGAATPGAQNASASADDDSGDGEVSHPPAGVFRKAGPNIKLIKPDPHYTAAMDVPDVATAGVAVPMMAIVKRDDKRTLVQGKFEWSMGDGASYHFFKNTPMDHIFAYPGDYTITMTYFSNELKEEPDSIQTKKITIIASAVAIVGLTDDGGLQIQNNSTDDIDLAGWVVASNGQTFTFPKYTTVVKEGVLFVSGKTMGIPVGVGTVLQNPGRKVIATYPASKTHPRPAATPSDRGGTEQTTSESQTSDWSATQSASVAEVSKSGFGEVFAKYAWYAAFAILVIIAIVAYLFRRLYADRHESDDALGEEFSEIL